ncbi:hypothetical protein A2363_03875 [Candidatus Gottesmanbacteria bacterium RIFOXYB1_FULL_47_11]|uniref:DUF304 domain-containing protein n=1 Tax=Candidatus Gottesmanbacteria bacterium RIFOXYB1_FULL_47_11 TaxID=1798401 RepID=A0A1F6BEE9_9BACT|nr:MAG: hypothetical protein A2363_03875 [Candidatus Gottesmanbacteria bacterium RIFOXYB1_FULL_47_11]
MTFDGQQDGERVLYTVTPHPIAKQLAIARIVFLSVFFIIILWGIGSIVPAASDFLHTIGVLLGLILLIIGTWWNVQVFNKEKTYITDRRIIRFDVVSPFFVTKRALFWNEALKAKAYAPNFFFRLMNIGTIDVEPILAEGEDVCVKNVYYFDDLANYIDKILFTFKNKPTDIALITPFIPKPRGQRKPAD